MTEELHFHLEQTGERECRLTLINVLQDRSAAVRNAAGWHICLGELAKHLDGRTAGGPHSDGALEWQPCYDAYVAAETPSGADVPAPIGQA